MRGTLGEGGSAAVTTSPIRFGSVCSGIEAASVAWLPLGWHCAFMSEIEPFPRAVLKHHYPETPLHGDFTTIQAGDYGPIDVLVGGTPCQSFSVAGLRGGIADDRGNLALEYLRLAQRLQPRFIVWENVPGVFSSLSHDAPDPSEPPDNLEEGSEWVGEDQYDADESHAFGCFLAGLSALGYGWAYRILDAQYAGLAQRRERVFVVGCAGEWARPSEILSLREGMRWHPAPRRKAGQRVAPTLESRANAGGAGWGTDWLADGGLTVAKAIPARPCSAHREDSDTLIAFDSVAGGNTGFAIGDQPGALRGGGRHAGHSAVAFGGNFQGGPIDVATACNAHPGGRYDFESETFVTQCITGEITHALTTRCGGRNAGEDGTGRGTPLVPVAFQDRFRGDDGRGYDRPPPVTEDLVGALETVKPWNVATPVASFQQSSMTGVGTVGYDADTQVLRPVKPQHDHQMLQMGSAVRRLTPRECERLQGFPDDYTLIPWRGGLASDGPRYRSLGNSMAVPVMRWIGQRIGKFA
jgi:DNA (cytosine-5)-methyltransferase 1